MRSFILKKVLIVTTLGFFIQGCQGELKAELTADEILLSPQTHVSFVNMCSGNKVAVSRSRESHLNVDLENLNPGEPLWVEIRVKPAQELPGQNSSLFRSKHLFFRRVPLNGKMHFTRRLNLSPSDQIWNASVNWTQGQGKLAGGSSAAIYSLSRDKIRNSRFFQVKDAVQCVWETGLKVSSEYHYNRDAAPLFITREYPNISQVSSERGVALGLAPVQTDRCELPLLKESDLGTGWIFAGMKSTFSESNIETLTRKWKVSGHQGGMFGDRISFSRIPVVEFVSQVARSGCRHWVKNREGLLDVGKHTSDFYVVPQDLAGSPNRAAEFMEKMRPTVNTCGNQLANGNAEFLIAHEDDEILFFYEQN